MTSSQDTHWLNRVAAAASLELQIPRDPDFSTLRRGWVQAARAWKISEEEFTRRAAAQFKIPVADLEGREAQALRFLPKSVCEQFGVLPLGVTESEITVATADPSNSFARSEIQRNSGRTPVFQMAGPFLLARALEEAQAGTDSAQAQLQALVEEAARTDFEVVTSDGRGIFTSLELEAPAVVKLGDALLKLALRTRASEVHLEPGGEKSRIRARIDGVLQDLLELPGAVQAKLVARFKHQAVDQDGHDPIITFVDDLGEEWQVHLLSADTPQGEFLTLRMVSPGRIPSVQDLGFSPSAASAVGRILAEKKGMVLITGPARSGKTTLVYAALQASEGAKVVSLENPVELLIPGTTQVQYDASSGLTFAETLQQLLNQNPDLIHAGEIRDLPTARTALRAALTGRKVLATVHAVDVVYGIRRLLDMGLAAGRLGESLGGVVSLRLLRRLCPECSRPFDAEGAGATREVMLSRASGVTPARSAVGCAACVHTGFRGQIPVAQVLLPGSGLRSALSGDPTNEELERACRDDGAVPLMAAALDRVRGGETTLEEVERVLGIPPKEVASPSSMDPVLVVEDEPQDRMIIGAVLKKMGLKMAEAPDGPSALKELQSMSRNFSLMILDLALPGMSGRDVLRETRRHLPGEALPVIVLTGSTNPQDEIDLLLEGADDYVLKPVVPSRLDARIRAVLRRRGFLLPN